MAASSLCSHCGSQPHALEMAAALHRLGECGYPQQGGSHVKGPSRRSQQRQMGKDWLLAWKALFLGVSSVKVGGLFGLYPFPKQSSKLKKTKVRKPLSHLVKQNT